MTCLEAFRPAELLNGVQEPPGHCSVLGRGRGITAHVIVSENTRRSVSEDRAEEDQARMLHAGFEWAYRDSVDADKPVFGIQHQGDDLFAIGTLEDAAEDPGRVL